LEILFLWLWFWLKYNKDEWDIKEVHEECSICMAVWHKAALGLFFCLFVSQATYLKSSFLVEKTIACTSLPVHLAAAVAKYSMQIYIHYYKVFSDGMVLQVCS